MKNKKNLIIIISLMILLIGAIIFTSYGFMASKIEGAETSKKFVFNSRVIQVTYSDGTEQLTSSQSYFVPGSKIEKTFTVKNTGDIPIKYSINLSDVINNFSRQEDLTYSLTSNGEILYNGLYKTEGIFPNSDETLLSKDTLEVGESKTYKLTINYLMSEENQIIDSGKVINGKITIDESIKTIKKLIVHGNSIQEGTPTAATPVEIKSLGSVSKNSIDMSEMSYSKSQISLSEQDGIYTFTPLVEKNITVTFSDVISLKTGETIIISFKINRHGNITNGLRYFNADTGSSLGYFADGVSENELTKHTYTYTATADINIKFQLYLHNFETKSYETDFSEFHIEKGWNFTGYEPYGDYIVLPLIISGNSVNIFDGNVNDTQAVTYRYKRFAFDNETYTLSITDKDTSVDISGISFGFTSKGSNSNGGFNWVVQNGKISNSGVCQNNVDNNNNAIEPMNFISVYPKTVESWNKIFQRFNVQIELGETATEYQPYKEPIVKKIILDEPLMKVGDCEECTDKIDFSNNTLTKNIAVRNIGDCQIVRYWTQVSSDNYSFYYCNTDTPGRTGNILSEHFIEKYRQTDDSDHIYFWSGGKKAYFGIDRNIVVPEDESAFKTWAINNNARFYYATLESTTNTIELPSISMPVGYDTIKVCSSNGVCASNIEVEYDE